MVDVPETVKSTFGCWALTTGAASHSPTAIIPNPMLLALDMSCFLLPDSRFC
jgi:hypothetical protein